MLPRRREALSHKLHVLWLAGLVITLSVGWFLIDGNVELNLADEGYLWYGTRAVSAGDVPMRDFQAYDPGRYLWSAAWSPLVGTGIVGLRLSCVFFQCFGLLAGLLAARRLSRKWGFLIVVALLLCAWMYPRFKIFEQSIALMSIYAGVLLVERPTLRRHFAIGVFGGLMAFMGRNHGVYHVVAFILIIAATAWGEGWRVWWTRVLLWGAGLLVGYLPQWLMFLFVPGYAPQFLADLETILRLGTNLATTVPWPWLVPVALPLWRKVLWVFEGCFYPALLLFLGIALLRALRLGWKGLRAHPVFLAAACVSLAYTHYVFSRPDAVHLAHSAPPMLLGAVALAGTYAARWPRLQSIAATALMAASLLAGGRQYGFSFAINARANSARWSAVNGKRMLVSDYDAQVLATAQRLVEDLAKPAEPVLFLPDLAGLYPFTGRRSPIREIYLLYPSTPEEDRALIAEVDAAGVQWVMLHHHLQDNRYDLSFRMIYPLAFAHLQGHFESVPIPALPTDMLVLHRLSHPVRNALASPPW